MAQAACTPAALCAPLSMPSLPGLPRLATPVSAALLPKHSNRCPLYRCTGGCLATLCTRSALQLVLRACVLRCSHLGLPLPPLPGPATSLARITGDSVMAALAGATSALCRQARPLGLLQAARLGWQFRLATSPA